MSQNPFNHGLGQDQNSFAIEIIVPCSHKENPVMRIEGKLENNQLVVTPFLLDPYTKDKYEAADRGKEIIDTTPENASQLLKDRLYAQYATLASMVSLCKQLGAKSQEGCQDYFVRLTHGGLRVRTTVKGLSSFQYPETIMTTVAFHQLEGVVAGPAPMLQERVEGTIIRTKVSRIRRKK